MDAKKFLNVALLAIVLIACASPVATPTFAPASSPTATETPSWAGLLTDDQAATLGSLMRVDDFPLYVMRYRGAYTRAALPSDEIDDGKPTTFVTRPASLDALPWACSLFAALADPSLLLYGRNFDWQFSPAVLLFADPPDGLASVSMVDIAYLMDASQVHSLTDLPLEARKPLLRAPFLPLDGMNEHGLVVGIAAVPTGSVRPDPNKQTIGSLGIVREMLDRAHSVDEAIALMQNYNVDMGSGPPLHYLIADRTGRAVLVEFVDRMIVIPNDAPWHAATNHWRATVRTQGASGCWRYDRIRERLAAAQGRLTLPEALDLLRTVAQGGDSATQWSVVYEFSSGQVRVVMGRQFDQAHTFQLNLAEPRFRTRERE